MDDGDVPLRIAVLRPRIPGNPAGKRHKMAQFHIELMYTLCYAATSWAARSTRTPPRITHTPITGAQQCPTTTHGLRPTRHPNSAVARGRQDCPSIPTLKAVVGLPSALSLPTKRGTCFAWTRTNRRTSRNQATFGWSRMPQTTSNPGRATSPTSDVPGTAKAVGHSGVSEAVDVMRFLSYGSRVASGRDPSIACRGGVAAQDRRADWGQPGNGRCDCPRTAPRPRRPAPDRPRRCCCAARAASPLPGLRRHGADALPVVQGSSPAGRWGIQARIVPSAVRSARGRRPVVNGLLR